jgi:hypothetical protein
MIIQPLAPQVSWSAKADRPRLRYASSLEQAPECFPQRRKDTKKRDPSRAAGAHQPIEWRFAPKESFSFFVPLRLCGKQIAATLALSFKKVAGGPPSRTMTKLSGHGTTP